MKTGSKCSEQPSQRFFYGLQPRWLSWDRLYRVYVSEQMLAGGYIAGQLYDEQSAAINLQQLGLLFRPLILRRLAERQEREARYDALNPFRDFLLDHDPRNFQIHRFEVAHTRFRRNRSLWTAFNVGVVEITLVDGSRRRFILEGDQEPDAVLRLIQRFDSALEVTGEPSPRPRPVPMAPAAKRRTLVLLAVLLLGLGALFGYVAWTGMVAPNPVHWPLAVVHVVLAVWCLVEARRVPERQPPVDKTGRTRDGGSGVGIDPDLPN